ncbi:MULTISPECIES: class I SAM-dependent methyltransferase [Leuconostoc]|uniref:S-adenosylmethionine (SAM)-dependent methyltransferase n=2 Tax=Leuconostoc kimchii TaxID=136609 RepID=D5T5G8_LEUKI|nr:MULTISPECIES: class I SAM-dependent methyltransferase [Leuconostoc]ADG41298.1 S-adenosylmethionine (SAM)-dependent methyltransferase [Leuconostoc kimchii IMSNU 11154]AEJ30722.1 S-adenosylmethionine (SAM)-dependent methyltransferase [Leuconostoc sp. C2]QBR47847.1 class I SAM-dependent methyltransferase [Leuconostoc kimchii]
MNNLFESDKIANQFNAYNDVLEQVLGYSHILSFFSKHQAETILDYGCGPGKVALRLAQQTGSKIIAVDESDRMIAIANQQRAHKRIDYQVVKNDSLSSVPSESLDGAIACYVFINNGSEVRIKRIMSEIYRVLRPKSHFIVLDTNPNTTGVPFSTFQNGSKDKVYGYGEQRVEKLHVNQQEDLILHDFNWPNQMYESNLKNAGFNHITVKYPTINDFNAEQIATIEAQYGNINWGNERTQSPFILYEATK